MVESNILLDISFTIKYRYRTNVTIIPFSRTNEITNALATGPIIVFQINKPYPYSSDRNSNYTRFKFETEQHTALLQTFGRSEAFYIFVALNRLYEIVSNRKDMVKFCLAVDIHNIPKNTAQKTRTVRMVKSSLSPKLEISVNRRFADIEKLLTIEELSNLFVRGIAGINAKSILARSGLVENFENLAQHMYALHLGTESAAAS